MNIESLRDRWVAEREHYQQLAEKIKLDVQLLTIKKSIRCNVTARAKEIASLLKKQLVNQFPDPWSEIIDKAGVRVVLTYAEHVEEVRGLIYDNFDVIRWHRKIDALDHDRMGYLGEHFEVKLKNNEVFRDMVCEIQLHTDAQHVWSKISHELFYKCVATPPSDVKRSFYRLIVLMELFDKEVSACRRDIMELPNHDIYKILNRLEHFYYPFVPRKYDWDLSVHVIAGLKGLYNNEELEKMDGLIEKFVSTHSEKLKLIFDRYKNDNRHLLLSQPESLLIFERVENAPLALEEKWEEFLPTELLGPLESIWGDHYSANTKG